MFGEIQYFERGVAYRIVNRKTRRCLSGSGVEVTSRSPKESWEQVWLLSEVRTDEFELVQMRTGEVLTWAEGKEEVRLEKGKMKNHQLWTLERAEIIDNVSFFWIRPPKEGSTLCASALHNSLRLSSIDRTLRITLWQIVPLTPTDPIFKGLSVLRSELSQLVLDVPESSHKEGTAVIQYRYNGGGNQRWVIEKYAGGEDFTIRNYCSGLCLTASFFKMGFKATQTLFNCGPEQRWRIVRQDNAFLLQSVSNEHYYLGISNEKGGSQATMSQEQEKAKWRIEGDSPI